MPIALDFAEVIGVYDRAYTALQCRRCDKLFMGSQHQWEATGWTKEEYIDAINAGTQCPRDNVPDGPTTTANCARCGIRMRVAIDGGATDHTCHDGGRVRAVHHPASVRWTVLEPDAPAVWIAPGDDPRIEQLATQLAEERAKNRQAWDLIARINDALPPGPALPLDECVSKIAGVLCRAESRAATLGFLLGAPPNRGLPLDERLARFIEIVDRAAPPRPTGNQREAVGRIYEQARGADGLPISTLTPPDTSLSVLGPDACGDDIAADAPKDEARSIVRLA